MKKNILFLTDKKYSFPKSDSFNVKIGETNSDVKDKIDCIIIDSDYQVNKDFEKDNDYLILHTFKGLDNFQNEYRHNIILPDLFNISLLEKCYENFAYFKNEINLKGCKSFFIKNNSSMKDIDKIIKTAISFFSINNFEFKFNFDLSLRELLTNAIRHGNKNNEKLYYYLHIIYNEEKENYLIIIEDNGQGFDLEKSYNNIDIEKVLREGKRGLFILKKISKRLFNIKNKVYTELTL